MGTDQVLELVRQALQVALMVSAPLLGAALVTGLVVGIFQAATQVNETTLSFIPKLVALFVALLVAGPWMAATLVEFMRRVLGEIPHIVG